MPESWRNILERAAANLSIELDTKMGPAFRQQPGGWPAARRPVHRPISPMESRELLAQELEAISTPSPAVRRAPQPRERALGQAVAVYKPAITQAVRQTAQPARPAPDKGNTGRELAALSISVMIVVLAIYGFFLLLH